MTDQPVKQSRTPHPKQFHIPADIARLGSYAVAIIEGMKAEHRKRRTER